MLCICVDLVIVIEYVVCLFRDFNGYLEKQENNIVFKMILLDIDELCLNFLFNILILLERVRYFFLYFLEINENFFLYLK